MYTMACMVPLVIYQLYNGIAYIKIASTIFSDQLVYSFKFVVKWNGRKLFIAKTFSAQTHPLSKSAYKVIAENLENFVFKYWYCPHIMLKLIFFEGFGYIFYNLKL